MAIAFRWDVLAACRGRFDVDWFDDDDPGPARAVCDSCPAWQACLEAGMNEPAGVWGGFTVAERVELGAKVQQWSPMPALSLADLLEAAHPHVPPRVRPVMSALRVNGMIARELLDRDALAPAEAIRYARRLGVVIADLWPDL